MRCRPENPFQTGFCVALLIFQNLEDLSRISLDYVLKLIVIYVVLFLQIDIQPPEREVVFSEEFRPTDPRSVGPCGGFSTQYACMCDFHGVPYRWVKQNSYKQVT